VSRIVFVSGATGYLGGAIAAALGARGFELRRGARRVPADPGGAHWSAYGDIGPATRWDAAVEGCDAVVHCAGLAHTPEGPAAAALAHQVNVEGTASLARAAVRAGVRRFVLMSSAHVLGARSRPGAPLTDDSTPRPDNVYAASKLAAEQRLIEVARDSRMEWLVLRPPMVYGRDAPGNFARLARLVASGVPLPLGAATAPKRFLGVDNLTSAVVRALEAPGETTGTFLLGDAEVTSTLDLVRRMADVLGRPCRTMRVPEAALRAAARLLDREHEVARLFEPLELDAQRFCAVLAWQPPVSLECGIERALGPVSARSD
jgi:nucleoside-diphosphate-sugar epimerase